MKPAARWNCCFRCLLTLATVLSAPAPHTAAVELRLENTGAFLWAEARALDSDGGQVTVGYPNGLRLFTEDRNGRFARQGQVDVPEGVRDLVVRDNVVYYINGNGSLNVLQLSPSGIPVFSDTADTDHEWVSLARHGLFLVAAAPGFIRLFDCSNPTAPVAAGDWSFPGPVFDIIVADTLILAAQGGGGLRIGILHGDGTITGAGRFVPIDSTPVLSVASDGRYAWVAQGDDGVLVLDLGDPTQPRAVARMVTFGNVVRVARGRDRLLVADSIFGLQSYRLIAPINPLWQDDFVSLNGVTAIWPVSARRFYVTEGDDILAINVDALGRLTLGGHLSHPGGYGPVVRHGDWAYVADDFGLWRVEPDSISGDSSFVRVMTGERAWDATVLGDRLIIAGGRSGVTINRIGSAGTLSLLSRVTPRTIATGVAVAEDTLIIMEDGYGFRIYDITDTHAPRFLGHKRRASVFTAGAPAGGRYFYLAERGRDITIYDLRYPVKPRRIGTLPATYAARQIVIRDRSMTVADHISGIRLYDISKPSTPRLAKAIPWPDSATVVVRSGRTLYVGDGRGDLSAVDVSGPEPALVLSTLRLPDAVVGMAKIGDQLLVTTRSAVHRVRIAPPVVPGDFSADGMTDAADLVALIDYVFRGGPPPFRPNAADVNGDGLVNLVDVVRLVAFLFDDGPALVVGNVE